MCSFIVGCIFSLIKYNAAVIISNHGSVVGCTVHAHIIHRVLFSEFSCESFVCVCSMCVVLWCVLACNRQQANSFYSRSCIIYDSQQIASSILCARLMACFTIFCPRFLFRSFPQRHTHVHTHNLRQLCVLWLLLMLVFTSTNWKSVESCLLQTCVWLISHGSHVTVWKKSRSKNNAFNCLLLLSPALSKLPLNTLTSSTNSLISN